ncbi:MAG: hypothetical protein K2K85_00775 [Clostridia bacterium]|nr:hypothetical protein [Clostridia bacterium]
MKSCAFFGHSKMNVGQHREKLLEVLKDLIENKGVEQFYSGFRGDFDVYCSFLVCELKDRFPQIKNTLVLSYIPRTVVHSYSDFDLPRCFDDSVYLLEKNVPKRLAIVETNKSLVDTVDFVVAGVMTHFGGAYMACEYAYRRKKPIISVIDGWEI